MPMHGELVELHARECYDCDLGSGIQFNTYVGRNNLTEPIYFSLLHLGNFEQGLKQEIATYLGITPEELDVDVYDPVNANMGPFTFDPPIRIEAGRLVSIYDYWRFCNGQRHSEH
jgi:hypothetical protein